MAVDGVDKLNRLIGKIVGRSGSSASSKESNFHEYMSGAPTGIRPKQDREDSVYISRDANKFANMAKELSDIRKDVMRSEGRGEYIGDGNPRYLEDSARAYNILRLRLGDKHVKNPAALNADIEILNVVLDRSIADEARELSQSADMHVFTQYITHGEQMLRERLSGANQKFLKSFFYLLNVMQPERAEESAGALLRKGESPSLERLSYADITRMKEFGRENKSMSLGAKWNMLSFDKALSKTLRDHFTMLYNDYYGKKGSGNTAAINPDDFFFYN